jgi:micrococcal nuclease
MIARSAVVNEIVLAVLLLLCHVPLSHGQDFEGEIIGVLGGDTLEVLHGKDVMLIRLDGVDAPEIGQPFGAEAQAFVASLALGKRAQVTLTKAGESGILTGRVSLPSGFNLSHELLKAGLAWWDRNAAPSNDSLWKLEREARLERRGLWKDVDPLPPWEWRKGF